MQLKSRFASDAALVLTTLIWGSTFIIAKDVLSEWKPLAYITIRFAIAACALSLMFPRELRRASGAEWKAGIILGALIGIGFAVQAVGQVYTTASKSAFITGLTTPLVPLVAFVMLRSRPSIENLIGVIVATIGGLILLAPHDAQASVTDFSSINTGDLLTLACTILFATHIVLLGVYTRKFAVKRLTVLQITAATMMFCVVFFGARLIATIAGADVLPLALQRETAALVWSAGVAWQLIYLGIVGTVAAFLLWTWGQARTTATHAAIIFTLEPVFATVFAVLWRGREEWAGGWATLGACLVLIGVLVSELRWRKSSIEETVV